jgi:sigma-E factor negative regulatory protein RseA
MNSPATRPQLPEHAPEHAHKQAPQHPHTLEHSPEHPEYPSRPWLSALVDGDVDAVQQACDAWRSDAQARADWHLYHLIGDVLRSEELAAEPAHDAQFLARLRLRLADEPVVLAPVPEPVALAPRRRRAAWLMPVAAAAGVAAVASVLVLGQADPQGAAPANGWAMNGPAASPPGLLAIDDLGNGTSSGAWPGQTGNAGARVLRDARLDHYLEAHRGALGVAVAVPGGAMRNAEVIVPAPEQR